MRKNEKTWYTFLFRLRLKRGWCFEVLSCLSSLLAMIFALVPGAMHNLTIYQPILTESALYSDPTRISYLALGDLEKVAGAKISIGHTEYNKDYYFTQKSADNTERHLIPDSSEFLKAEDVHGRFPTRSGEAVISTREIVRDFVPYNIESLSNNLGLPTSYEIVGWIYLADQKETLFLHEDAYSITSLYQDYKEHLRSPQLDFDLKTDLLYFDQSLPLNTIEYSGSLLKTAVIDLLASRKIVQVASIGAGPRKILRVNPELFSPVLKRCYITCVFDSYQQKREYLTDQSLRYLYDRFSPSGGENMKIILAVDSNIFYSILLIYLSFLVLLAGISCPRRSFNKTVRELRIDGAELRKTDLMLAMLGQILALVIGLTIYFIYPFLFASATSLGFLPLSSLLLMLFVWLCCCLIWSINRWRSHEI